MQSQLASKDDWTSGRNICLENDTVGVGELDLPTSYTVKAVKVVEESVEAGFDGAID